MVNLASVLSVSFLEDAVCADAGLCASVCWEREERAGPQHRWLMTSDRLCIQVWGVDTPEHPHWMGTSDRTGTACLPPLVFQHSRLTLCTSRWWPGWVGTGSQRERAGSVVAKLRSPSQPCKLFGCWCEDAISVELLGPPLSARDASHHEDAGELMNADDSERTEPSTRIIMKKHVLRWTLCFWPLSQWMWVEEKGRVFPWV